MPQPLGMGGDEILPALVVGDGEPCGNAQEARPPYRPHGGIVPVGREGLAPEGDQALDRVGDRPFGGLPRIGIQNLVDDRSALGGAGDLVERLQRPQLQDVPGIDRIGIALQRLDLGHRQPRRPEGQWWRRIGPPDRTGRAGLVEAVGEGDDRLATGNEVAPDGRAEHGREALHPA